MEAHPMNIAFLVAVAALQQPPATAGPAVGQRLDTVLIRAGRLIDGRSDEARTDQGILVAGERIAEVGSWGEIARHARGARVIDLSRSTVLPGLIDDHTHILLQGDVTSQDYDSQLLEQSIAYRALLASRNVRWALLEGYTALRDVETEGAQYADVDVKRAIERGVIPGPRLWVSTRALAPTGMYPIQSANWELDLPKGVQIVDGPDDIRRAVREQVAHGADWIKFYADRRYYLAGDGTVRSWVNFTDEELQALVGEAHRLGRPVAAHAIGRDGIAAALRAGVNSIEHGDGITDSLAQVMAQRGVFWCPTIYVGVYVAPGRTAAGAPIWQQLVEAERRAFASALRAGVKIANGTDAGGYPWTEPLAREFSYLVRYGMTPMQAIKAGTSVAAELLGQQASFGTIEAGRLADLIAVAGNPLQDITELERVRFVMKGGTVYKQE
jgi:imidazolonepropionase-like amidohydrolase